MPNTVNDYTLLCQSTQGLIDAVKASLRQGWKAFGGPAATTDENRNSVLIQAMIRVDPNPR